VNRDPGGKGLSRPGVYSAHSGSGPPTFEWCTVHLPLRVSFARAMVRDALNALSELPLETRGLRFAEAEGIAFLRALNRVVEPQSPGDDPPPGPQPSIPPEAAAASLDKHTNKSTRDEQIDEGNRMEERSE